MLAQILEAAGRLNSGAQAAIALHVRAGLDISGRHVSRLTRELGAELAQVRDAKTRKRRRRGAPPAERKTPAVVAVEVDGGRLWTRPAGAGPGVQASQAKEDKIACPQSLQSSPHAQDPHPEPPSSFLDAPRVARLVQRVKRQTAETAAAAPPAAAEAAPTPEAAEAGRAQPLPQPEPWVGAPKRLVRTCVATMQKSKAFGPMVAGEAHARGFYEAGRRAFVGDGQAYTWAIQRGYFPDFVPIVDFLHVLCYRHWDRPEGAEAILQVRAAVLSQDERLERFFAERPGNPYRRRRSA